MLISLILCLISIFGSTIAEEKGLCRSFTGTFERTATPQTLTMYAYFSPSKVTLGGEDIYVEKNYCASSIQKYACQLRKVHGSGFWHLEINNVVTANVDSITLSGSSKSVPQVTLQALPLVDEPKDKFLLQSSAPFVLCPDREQKSVDVVFVFSATILRQPLNISFYVEGDIQCEIGQNPTNECHKVFYSIKNASLAVTIEVERFQAPSRRYITVSAVIAQEGQEKILTKIVDFGSTVWNPICERYDGTFSFEGSVPNITAYLPFKAEHITMGHNFTFAKGKCVSELEVLECTQTKVPGAKVFKFDIYNVSKRNIQTIQFFNPNAENPPFVTLYKKELTDLEQFLFSPKYSAPFVHCPSPSSYYADIICATKYRSMEGLRVSEGDSILCKKDYNDGLPCLFTKGRDRNFVHQRVYRSTKSPQFTFITCEMTIENQLGHMTHLIDFGKKDAFEIGKDDIEEKWSQLGQIYNGTYQLNSRPPIFYAFMDFKPKALNKYTRMDGEYCYYGQENYTCKIRKVIGSSFWRVEVKPMSSLHANKLTFTDDRNHPTRGYAMYSTPFSESAKDHFIHNLSQPFVHDSINGSTVSIRCVFHHKLYSTNLQFKVSTKYRTVCVIQNQQSPTCDNVRFNQMNDTVTVTVNVYRGDINEDRYGIFTCEYNEHQHLYHVVDFGPKMEE